MLSLNLQPDPCISYVCGKTHKGQIVKCSVSLFALPQYNHIFLLQGNIHDL